LVGRRYKIPKNICGLQGLGYPMPANRSDDFYRRMLDRRGWDFPWPLLTHQFRFFRAIEGRIAYNLWSPTGSGKKIMGSALICLAQRPNTVVVTRAADIPGWLDAIRKYTGLEAVAMRGLTPSKAQDVLAALPGLRAGRVVGVTGWETLHPGVRGEFFAGWAGWIHKMLPGATLILDESHYAKNPKRWIRTVLEDGEVEYTPKENRSAATMLLSRGASFRLLMSASPVANKLHDLWAQLDLGEPGCYGSQHDFGMRYCGAEHNGYGWEYKGRSNAGELKRRLKWSAVSIKRSEYADQLPEVRYETIRIPREDQDLPDSVPRELRAAMRGNDDVRLAEALVMEAAIRKTTVTIRKVRRAVDSGQKVVVFTGRRREVKRIAAAVRAKRPQVAVWAVDGGDTVEQRHEIRKEYMAHPGPCVLVATGHSMGESVDIQDTDLAVLAMLPWTPVHLIQWIGRFSRLGGTRKCLVSFMVAVGTYDDEMRVSLLDKLEDVQASIEDADATTYADALAEKLNQAKAMSRLKDWLGKMRTA